MEMTIKESLEWLISRKEHYEMGDNCQKLAQALDTAIGIMRKYQKIEQIVKEMKDSESDIVGLYRHNTEYYIGMIERVLEDGNDD